MADLSREAAERYPSNTTTGRDFKAWAKRLVWREENGDKNITSLQSQFAREALGMEIKNNKGDKR